PNDSRLYIAQRALELTKNAVRDGGEIFLLAACTKGIGESKTMQNFYDRLTASLDQVLKSIESQYNLFGHKAYRCAG
ncbi:MAG: nickel-dependent lactate racemase, partial [Planctomycetota bacterium]